MESPERGRYHGAFLEAFGDPLPTTERLTQAISAYVRSVRSTVSAYDRFAAGNDHALTMAARRGLDLFRGRAGCVACHTIEGDRPSFTDHEFHDTGVGWENLVRNTPLERLERPDPGEESGGSRTVATPVLDPGAV